MTVADLLINLKIDEATPAELENKRREIIGLMTTKYQGYDDPNVPMELLQALALITSTLRRKNAGPPKSRRPNGTVPRRPTTVDELDF